MRLLAAIGVLSVFCFLTSACGSGKTTDDVWVASGAGSSITYSANPSNSSKPIQFIDVGRNDGAYNWRVANITMPNGKTLTCIKTDSSGDSPISVSCNWELFNKESGR